MIIEFSPLEPGRLVFPQNERLEWRSPIFWRPLARNIRLPQRAERKLSQFTMNGGDSVCLTPIPVVLGDQSRVREAAGSI
jgi:hypothetical protein